MNIMDTDEVRLWQGDCRDLIASLPDASVDSCVTDPPYELGFMGRSWDRSGIAYDVDLWRDVLRVLKPGGHLLAFGGSRTWHRLAAAIEDAGFELRDSIAWLYGSGFPKSMDVSKAVDATLGAKREPHKVPFGKETLYRAGGANTRPWMEKAREQGYAEVPGDIPVTPEAAAWQGWGTALKPAFEPIVVARKPLDGTVAHNVLTHGVGGLNVDGCRVGDEVLSAHAHGVSRLGTFEGAVGNITPERVGRFPPNVILDASQAASLDAQSGVLKSGLMPPGTPKRGKAPGILGEFKPQPSTSAAYGDEGGASRFFPTFHWQAKATTSERPNVNGVQHPTVKPLELMCWLVRLVTPRGGLVLDPFAGSGTTVEAALMEGDRVVAAEREAVYIPLIRARVEKPIAQSLDLWGDAA